MVRDAFKKAVDSDDLGWDSPACFAFVGCLLRKEYSEAKSVAEFEMPNASSDEISYFIDHWKTRYSATDMNIVLIDKTTIIAELSDANSPKWNSKYLVRIGTFVGISYPVRPCKNEKIKFSLRTHCENDDYDIDCLDEIREIILK